MLMMCEENSSLNPWKGNVDSNTSPQILHCNCLWIFKATHCLDVGNTFWVLINQSEMLMNVWREFKSQALKVKCWFTTRLTFEWPMNGRHPFLRWWGVGVFSILESWWLLMLRSKLFYYIFKATNCQDVVTIIQVSILQSKMLNWTLHWFKYFTPHLTLERPMVLPNCGLVLVSVKSAG